MRLFIAFDASSEAEKELVRVQQKLTDARLTLVREFHLTLKFLGDVEENRLDGIRERLRDVDFSHFEAVLDGIGAFLSGQYIKVVWVGLEPQDRIKELQKSIEAVLKGIFPAEKRFHPHITLARVKYIKNKAEFQENIAHIKVKQVRWEVDRFKLIKSELRPEGPMYTVLEEFKAADSKN